MADSTLEEGKSISEEAIFQLIELCKTEISECGNANILTGTKEEIESATIPEGTLVGVIYNE